jgi:hypothetical protein
MSRLSRTPLQFVQAQRLLSCSKRSACSITRPGFFLGYHANFSLLSLQSTDTMDWAGLPVDILIEFAVRLTKRALLNFF